MKRADVYLAFGGECEAAFEFYKSVFGGEFSMMLRFEEGQEEMKKRMSEADMQKIMHVSLPAGQSVLMGSDMPGSTPGGGSFAVSITADSRKEADELFAALSAGGKATMPMDDAFWGDYFGMLNDKFGVQWMVSCESKE